MITITDNTGTSYFLRPTPLVSISQNPIRNKEMNLGSSYSITFNGTIIAHAGSPITTLDGDALSTKFANDDTNPANQTIINTDSDYKGLDAILAKQNAIRELFAKEFLTISIGSMAPEDESRPDRIMFQPIVDSVSFEEGVFLDICRYSITMTAPVLYDGDGKINGGGFGEGETLQDVINASGGLVDSYSDDWSIEVDDTFGSISENEEVIPRAYRLTRNLSATGRQYFSSGDATVSRVSSWESARDFLKAVVFNANNSQDQYPNPLEGIARSYGSGLINISSYNPYNHTRSESINKTDGTYGISESWLLASGDNRALETYNVSIQTSTDDPFVQVSIDGSLRGVSKKTPSGIHDPSDPTPIAYQNARSTYLDISNNGKFGVGCPIYKRVNNLTEQTLNSQPVSISLGSNQINGELTYNLQFNNRPANVFTGVLSEGISINDTYPGDVYAIIPVLGRATGPILQHVGGRTEYSRSLAIDMVLDYTDVGYGDQRADLVLLKPSINEPIRTELRNLVIQASPANEPGVRKYFLSPPTESWNPKTGAYSLNLDWTYELDT